MDIKNIVVPMDSIVDASVRAATLNDGFSTTPKDHLEAVSKVSLPELSKQKEVEAKRNKKVAAVEKALEPVDKAITDIATGVERGSTLGSMSGEKLGPGERLASSANIFEAIGAIIAGGSDVATMGTVSGPAKLATVVKPDVAKSLVKKSIDVSNRADKLYKRASRNMAADSDASNVLNPGPKRVLASSIQERAQKQLTTELLKEFPELGASKGVEALKKADPEKWKQLSTEVNQKLGSEGLLQTSGIDDLSAQLVSQGKGLSVMANADEAAQVTTQTINQYSKSLTRYNELMDSSVKQVTKAAQAEEVLKTAAPKANGAHILSDATLELEKKLTTPADTRSLPKKIKDMYISFRSLTDEKYAHTMESMKDMMGKDYEYYKDPSRLYEQVNKADGYVRVQANGFLQAIKKFGADETAWLKTLAVSRRFSSRLKSGKEHLDVGGWTKEKSEAVEWDALQRLGHQNYLRVDNALKEFDKMTKAGLDAAVDYGLISKKAAKAIRADNDFYATIQVLDYASDYSNVIRGTVRSSADVIKKSKGLSEENIIGDVLENSVNTLHKIHTKGLLNRANRGVASIVEQSDAVDTHIIGMSPKVAQVRRDAIEELGNIREGRKVLEKAFETVKNQLAKISKETTTILGKKTNARLNALNKRLKDYNKKATELDESLELSISMNNSDEFTQAIKQHVKTEGMITRTLRKIQDEAEMLSTSLLAKAKPRLDVLERLDVEMSDLGGMLNTKKGEGKALRDMIKAINKDVVDKEDTLKAANYVKVKYYEDGSEGFMWVRKDVANEIGTLPTSIANDIFNFATVGGKAFRAGSTTLNLAFQLVKNPMVDSINFLFVNKTGFRRLFSDASFTQKFSEMVAMPFDLARGLGCAMDNLRGKVRPETLEYFKQGGTINSALRFDTDTMWKAALGNDGAKALGNTKLLWNQTKEGLQNILALWEDGSKIANTVRLNRIKADLVSRGKWTQELENEMYHNLTALMSFGNVKDVGEGLRIMNTMTPFLSASIKATWNALGVMRGKFGKQAQKESLMAMASIGMPPVLLAALNNNSDENTADYEAIHPGIRASHIIFLLPGYRENDHGQPIRNRIQIPMLGIYAIGNGAASATVRAIKGQAGKEDWDYISGLLHQELFQNVGAGSTMKDKAGKLISRAAPLPKTVAEIAAGRSFFTNKPIIAPGYEKAQPSEQYDLDTPEYLVAMSQALASKGVQVSPMQTQHMITSLWSAAYNQTLVRPEDKRGFLATLPGIDRLIGKSTETPYNKTVKLIGDLSEQIGDVTETVTRRRLAEKISRLVITKDDDKIAEAVKMIEANADDPKLVKLIENNLLEDLRLQDGWEKFLMTKAVPVRAQYMATVFLDLKTDEQKQRFIVDHIDAGVMTNDTAKYFMALIGEN